MNADHLDLPDAIDAYLTGTTLLDVIVPGSRVDLVENFRHIHFGRPRANISDEIIVGDHPPAEVLAVLARHPQHAPSYVTAFLPLEAEPPPEYEQAGIERVVRTTLMTFRLPGERVRPDPSLRRLTDLDELRQLVQIRGDDVLTVEHFTDAVRCYALSVDGDTVSSALLVPTTHDTGVVEHVHTLPAYRRRGYGRWLMRAINAEAAQLGLQHLVLGSNVAGRPLYTALGYIPRCHQDVYLWRI